MLHYSIHNNHFTADDPDDRLAQPVDVTMNSREDLIEEITGPGSILKTTEVNAVIDNYWQQITDYIREGEGYTDDYVRTRFGISGVFQNDDDQFDPVRHEVLVNIIPKNSVTGVTDEITLRRVDGRHIAPEIESIFDWSSATDNDFITPDGVLEVIGNNLKIHNNLEEEGVFFVSQSDDSETKATQVRTNEPKTLTLQVPGGLAAGTYRLEVRNTSYTSNTLRTGIFTPELTVE